MNNREIEELITDAIKWRELMDYFEGWPYSPYDDTESRSLANAVRDVRDGKGVQDGLYKRLRGLS